MSLRRFAGPAPVIRGQSDRVLATRRTMTITDPAFASAGFTAALANIGAAEAKAFHAGVDALAALAVAKPSKRGAKAVAARAAADRGSGPTCCFGSRVALVCSHFVRLSVKSGHFVRSGHADQAIYQVRCALDALARARVASRTPFSHSATASPASGMPEYPPDPRRANAMAGKRSNGWQ
jgi:hypothetical protein